MLLLMHCWQPYQKKHPYVMNMLLIPRPGVDEMKMQKAEELLTELKMQLYSCMVNIANPMAAGCLKMIPANSKQYAEAEKLI